MRTVGIGAKKGAADDLEAKLAEAEKYAETRDKQIKELEAKLAEAEKTAKTPAKK